MSTFGRRRLLGIAGAAAIGLTGCGVGRRQVSEPLNCAPRSAMTAVSTVGDRRLVYEVTGAASRFPIDAAFLSLVESWQHYWTDHSGLPAHDQLWTYGAWVDKGGCTSWHGAGRALDISRLRRGGVPIVSCREDLWSVMDDHVQRDRHRRRYWALAASLHLHFAYVLTYLYDDAHRNHIHIDNAVSGTAMTRFDPDSRVQNQALQAICTHLWDTPVDITGEWDRDTRRATATVLSGLGIGGDAARRDNWATLLSASVGRSAS